MVPGAWGTHESGSLLRNLPTGTGVLMLGLTSECVFVFGRRIVLCKLTCWPG